MLEETTVVSTVPAPRGRRRATLPYGDSEEVVGATLRTRSSILPGCRTTSPGTRRLIEVLYRHGHLLRDGLDRLDGLGLEEILPGWIVAGIPRSIQRRV